MSNNPWIAEVETFDNGKLGVWLLEQDRERRLGLLRPRLNAGPVCDDSAAEGSICANTALYK